MSKFSFLTPSRQRIELLKQSVESLGNEGLYDVIVRVDDDDPQLEQYQDYAGQNERVALVIGKRHGYGGLHEYYNEMSEKADGDWLFLWNDDGRMETREWYRRLTVYDPRRPMVLSPYHPVNNLFPVVSRAWYEAVGHFSLSPHADSWVQQIGEKLGNQVFVPDIHITHDGESLHDDTHNQVREVVRDTSARHRSMDKERELDAEKIKDYAQKKGFIL